MRIGAMNPQRSAGVPHGALASWNRTVPEAGAPVQGKLPRLNDRALKPKTAAGGDARGPGRGRPHPQLVPVHGEDSPNEVFAP